MAGRPAVAAGRQPVEDVIPDGDRIVECDGVCTVTVEDGLIRRNEVYFDRTPLMLGKGEKRT